MRPARIEEKIHRRPDGCWEWTGCKSRGYGLAWDGERLRPAHLEPVTCRENLLRGETLAAAQVAQTHCKQGHEFTPENTYVHRRMRHCRACHRERNRLFMREFYARKRAAQEAARVLG